MFESRKRHHFFPISKSEYLQRLVLRHVAFAYIARGRTEYGEEPRSSMSEQSACHRCVTSICKSLRRKWCPNADLNHGHADFQSKAVEPETAPYPENSVKLNGVIQALSTDLSNSLHAHEFLNDGGVA